MAYKDKKKMSDYVNSRNREVYDRIGVMVPKGHKEQIAAHAAARGESVNGFIGRAITETMKRDSETPSTQTPVEGA